MYNVWENALAEIEQKISAVHFSTWFQNTSLISTEDGNIIIGVKNPFYVKQLRSKFLDVIKEALIKNNVEVKSIDFEIQAKTSSKITPREIVAAPTLIKEKVSKTKESLKSTFSNTGLNSKYTLETFIVGSNNDIAAAAAQSIIDAPGTRCNPFFLYGGSGLGKTHLVQAIGNALLKKNPNFKILYTPISDFYSDFIDAVRSGKGKEFSQKFQELDCLIIDDF